MKNRPVTDAEKQKIIDLLQEHGGNRTRVANMTKRCRRTICKIADEAAIESVHSDRTKNARAARVAYSQERRLDLIGRGFDKAQELLANLTESKDLQAWTVAVGVLTDKARLEMGEATSRSENVSAEEADRRKKIKESLSAFAAAKRLDRPPHNGGV